MIQPERPIRVARIITRLNVGGPSIQAVNLSHRLTAQGFRTLLVHGRVASNEGDMGYLLTGQDMETAYVADLQRRLAPVSDIRAWWQIYRLLCRFQPDLVHTHMAKAGTLGRLAAIAYNLGRGRGPRARLVHTYHGHVFEGYFTQWLTAVFVRIERMLAHWTDVLIAISPEIARDLEERYKIARSSLIQIIPLGFDLSPFVQIDDGLRRRSRHELQIPEDAPVVTTVGRLTAVKQYDLFLEAASIVSQRHPDTVFLVVGDGELRPSLERLADHLGIRGCVRFLGWRQDLTRIYGATDVFVLTSRNEGTPVALIEAMAAGVPGVSTDVGGVRYVMCDQDTGVLMGASDPQAIADTVSESLRAPDRRRAMGERSRQAVLARFGIGRLVDDIAALYRSLVSNRGPEVRG